MYNVVGMHRTNILRIAYYRLHINLGFTLVELLVSIGLLAVLSAGVVSIIGTGPAKTGRDGKRQTDLQSIASALELYRNDNGTYPQCTGGVTGCTAGSLVNGTGMPSFSGYLSTIPGDVKSPTREYRYAPLDSSSNACDGTLGDKCVKYSLCAALENGTGSVVGCGTCGATTCNVLVLSP